MKNIISTIFVIMFLLSASSVSWAEDTGHSQEKEKPARTGEEISKACAACHGEKGISISPDFPNLAGQYKSYLVHSLKGYRSGERSNALMQPFVQGLSDQEIKNVAAFYAAQSGLEPLQIAD